MSEITGLNTFDTNKGATKVNSNKVIVEASKILQFVGTTSDIVYVGQNPDDMFETLTDTILEGMINRNSRVVVVLPDGKLIEMPRFGYVEPLYFKEGNTYGWGIQVPKVVWDLEGIRRGVEKGTLRGSQLQSLAKSALEEAHNLVKKRIVRSTSEPGCHADACVGDGFLEKTETAINEVMAEDMILQAIRSRDENAFECLEVIKKRLSTESAAQLGAFQKNLRMQTKVWYEANLIPTEIAANRDKYISEYLSKELRLDCVRAMDGMMIQDIRFPSTVVPELTLRIAWGMKANVILLCTEIMKIALLGDNDGDQLFLVLRPKIRARSKNLNFWSVDLGSLGDKIPDIWAIDTRKSLKAAVKGKNEDLNGDPIQILVGMEMRHATGIMTYFACAMCMCAMIQTGAKTPRDIKDVYERFLRVFSNILESVMDGWKMSDTETGARLVSDLINFFSGRVNLPETTIRAAYSENGWSDEELEHTLTSLKSILTYDRDKEGGLADFFSPRATSIGMGAMPVQYSLLRSAKSQAAQNWMWEKVMEVWRDEVATKESGVRSPSTIIIDSFFGKDVIVDQDHQYNSREWVPTGRALKSVKPETIQLKGKSDPRDLTNFLTKEFLTEEEFKDLEGMTNEEKRHLSMVCAFDWALREYLPTIIVKDEDGNDTKVPAPNYGWAGNRRLKIEMPHRHTRKEFSIVELPLIRDIKSEFKPQSLGWDAKIIDTPQGRFLARPMLTNKFWNHKDLLAMDKAGDLQDVVDFITSDRTNRNGVRYSPWMVLGAEALLAKALVDQWVKIYTHNGSYRGSQGEGMFRVALSTRTSHWERFENLCGVLMHSNEMQSEWPGKSDVPVKQLQYDTEMTIKICVARQLQKMGFNIVNNNKRKTLEFVQPDFNGTNLLMSTFQPLYAACKRQRTREWRNVHKALDYVKPSKLRVVNGTHKVPDPISKKLNEAFVIYANLEPLVWKEPSGKITSPDQFGVFKSAERLRFIHKHVVYSGPDPGKNREEWIAEYGPTADPVQSVGLMGGLETPRVRVTVEDTLNGYRVGKLVSASNAMKGVSLPLEGHQWYAYLNGEMIPVDYVLPAQSIIDKDAYAGPLRACMSTLATPEEPWVVRDNMSLEEIQNELVPEIQARLIEAGRVDEDGFPTMRIPVYDAPIMSDDHLVGHFYGGYDALLMMPHGENDYRSAPVKTNFNLVNLMGYGLNISKGVLSEIDNWADIHYRCTNAQFASTLAEETEQTNTWEDQGVAIEDNEDEDPRGSDFNDIYDVM
jgi:hypothetical protein